MYPEQILPTARGWRRQYLLPQRQDPLTPSDTPGYDPRAQDSPWCPGNYRLDVARIDVREERPTRRLGALSFEVRGSGRRAPRPSRASHGVAEQRFGKDVVGIPYREVLRLYGAPKTVPPEWRTTRDGRCLYYDLIEREQRQASMVNLCIRNGRVAAAGGSGTFVDLRHPRRRRR